MFVNRAGDAGAGTTTLGLLAFRLYIGDKLFISEDLCNGDNLFGVKPDLGDGIFCGEDLYIGAAAVLRRGDI